MSDLYFVTVTLAGPVQQQLHFDSPERARNAFDSLSRRVIGGGIDSLPSLCAVVDDDYGVKLSVDLSSVLAVAEINMNKQQEAQIEAGMITARSNARAQQKAQSDPTLKLLTQPPGAFANGLRA